MKNIVFCRPLIIALKRGLNKRFTRYMESNMCQVAACLIPKFKLNWAVEDDRNNIKNSLIETLETIIDNASLTNSQDLQSTSNTTSTEHHNSDIEDDFFNFEENNSIISNIDYKLLVDNYLSNTNINLLQSYQIPLKNYTSSITLPFLHLLMLSGSLVLEDSY
ncbi:unnamed protein product [Macrosiphum euphorbiae]|uniref:Uncharacterized protein n=1 Tax=Macrosiphum euphorbiae TaxID=13131 RepID=A0AAV0Y5R1_9HEMI|nr:unnamed protein product [Macrosiphum euphorbiae]